MKELRFLWPLALTASMMGARIWELRRKFSAEPGRIVAPASFRNLVSVGTGSVMLCVAEYLLRGAPPRFPWISAIGAVVGALTFVLRGLSRRALDRMWSVHVEIRERHLLVREGPYALMRHPIYAAAILEVLATAMLLNSWIAGAVGLLATISVLAGRIRAEEAAMEGKFGEEWRQYRRRVGAFWPKP